MGVFGPSLLIESTDSMITVVLQKRAHGWCTLPWAHTGGGPNLSYQYCVLLEDDIAGLSTL